MDRTSVAVCVLTLWRPRGLRASLEGLSALDAVDADVSIVVVDNDEEGSASAVIEELRPRVPHPIHYVVEPRRGITFGRNRAVDEARSVGATHLAFLDDDEIPTAGWLRELLRVQRETGADAVIGPVVPRFEVPPPAWVLQGRFFEPKRRATGESMHFGNTNNVLVTMDIFGNEVTPFPEWAALSGGEDTHFFKRAILAGRRVVWCDEAEVLEVVPPSRVDPRWLLRRRYRAGNTLSLCLVDLQDSPVRRIRRTAGALLRMARGLLRAGIGLVRGRAVVLAGLQEVSFGAGQLTGLLGRRYDEYRVVHGN